MALPKLNTVLYDLELPSSGKKIEYRPFLVKEQKNLMLASESEDETEIQNAASKKLEKCQSICLPLGGTKPPKENTRKTQDRKAHQTDSNMDVVTEIIPVVTVI